MHQHIKKLIKKNNIGYTFIELLVVISIIILLASLSIPAIINYQSRQQENEAVKNLISLIKTTQNNAMTSDRSYSVTPEADGNIAFCVFNSVSFTSTQDCVRVKNIYQNFPTFYIDRYGNTVNGNLTLVSRELNFSTASGSILVSVGRFGRVSFK